MIQWFKNFVENPRSTIQGLVGGGVILALFGYMTTQLNCDFSLFSWPSLAAVIIPILIGGGAADKSAPVTPPVA